MLRTLLRGAAILLLAAIPLGCAGTHKQKALPVPTPYYPAEAPLPAPTTPTDPLLPGTTQGPPPGVAPY